MEEFYEVFLGGTCNGSKWRDSFVKDLKCRAFNPVVEDWNAIAQAQELYWRKNADFCLYCITPLMSGFYSIAEAVDDSNKRPFRTLFCVVAEDQGLTWEPHQIKSLEMTKQLLSKNYAQVFENLNQVKEFLNKYYDEEN